jgi:hypothetical protein
MFCFLSVTTCKCYVTLNRYRRPTVPYIRILFSGCKIRRENLWLVYLQPTTTNQRFSLLARKKNPALHGFGAKQWNTWSGDADPVNNNLSHTGSLQGTHNLLLAYCLTWTSCDTWFWFLYLIKTLPDVSFTMQETCTHTMLWSKFPHSLSKLIWISKPIFQILSLSLHIKFGWPEEALPFQQCNQ